MAYNPYIPANSTQGQVALLALMIPGEWCAYSNVGGDDLKKAIGLIRQYCATPELGMAWRNYVEFTPPGSQQPGGAQTGAGQTGAGQTGAGQTGGAQPGGSPFGNPFGGPFGFAVPFSYGAFGTMPGFGFGFGYGGMNRPNEVTLRNAVVTLLTVVFLSPDGPFTMTKPLPIRKHFAKVMTGNLADFVACLRIVEDDFRLPHAPYDVAPSK